MEKFEKQRVRLEVWSLEETGGNGYSNVSIITFDYMLISRGGYAQLLHQSN